MEMRYRRQNVRGISFNSKCKRSSFLNTENVRYSLVMYFLKTVQMTILWIKHKKAVIKYKLASKWLQPWYFHSE